MKQKEKSEEHGPVISFHALWGTEGCQTMKVLGRIKKQSLIMLIDSRSIHNFMDFIMATRLKCKIDLITGINVTVANGETLKAQKICKSVD